MNSLIDHRPTTQATQEYFTLTHTIQAKSADPRASCCYPSKRCGNPRVLKRNGELHRFCEFHRSKANSNQRKLERRRKVEEMVEQLPIEEYMQQLNEQYELLVREDETRCEQLPPSDLLIRLDLDEDDLRVLAAVLCVDDKTTTTSSRSLHETGADCLKNWR